MDKQQLICMRLNEMFRVHPKQIERKCDKCGEICGIYPSGQELIRKFGKENIEIICNRCREPAKISILAPGSLQEAKESVLKNN